MLAKGYALLYFLLLLVLPCSAVGPQAEVVSFQSGEIILHGTLYKPEGKGPFPAVVYNHGSAPGLLSKQAFEALGPVFAKHGWVFFGPNRRGQGLSSSAGPYIGDQSLTLRKREVYAQVPPPWFGYWRPII